MLTIPAIATIATFSVGGAAIGKGIGILSWDLGQTLVELSDEVKAWNPGMTK